MVAKPHKTVLFWFRRAVRLEDNRALRAALEAAEFVVPVFILDPTILKHPSTGPARTQFLFDSLRAVDANLRARQGRLIVRHGKPVDALLELCEETHAGALFFGREYEPYGRERDQAVETALRARGVAVETFSDHLLFEPHEIATSAGTPFTVFTPFKRVWFEQPVPAPLDAPVRVAVPADIRSEPLPALPKDAGVGGALEQEPRVRGGEAEARRWLDTFLAECVGAYKIERDVPAREGTSRLSAYLRAGVLSPRQAVAALRNVRAGLPADAQVGVDTWLSELAWRDFYYQILYHFPHVAGHAFRPQFDDLPWENDETLFQAWCDGRTGYPFVDAAQRQMNREAWMHNRARMVSASFLTKDLLVDWRLGERYFMQKLVDGDQASNNGGWQWVAGTGTDAQPFFRVFNPVLQGEKFDPDGAYVRRYVPELARVPVRFIHRPWEMSLVEQSAVGCVLGRDYPLPIVDHAEQRKRALLVYGQKESGVP